MKSSTSWCPRFEAKRRTRAHDAFNRPDLGVFDLDAFYRLAAPDLVVDWSRSNGVEAGIYRGEAATRRFWHTFFEAFERVVVDHLRAWGRDGLAVDAHAVVALTLRAGRIVE